MSFFDDETTKTTEPAFGARLAGPRKPGESDDSDEINPFPPGVGQDPEVVECITPEPEPRPGEEEPPTGSGPLAIKAVPRKRRRHSPSVDAEVAQAIAEFRELLRAGRLPS